VSWHENNVVARFPTHWVMRHDIKSFQKKFFNPSHRHSRRSWKVWGVGSERPWYLFPESRHLQDFILATWDSTSIIKSLEGRYIRLASKILTLFDSWQGWFCGRAARIGFHWRYAHRWLNEWNSHYQAFNILTKRVWDWEFQGKTERGTSASSESLKW